MWINLFIQCISLGIIYNIVSKRKSIRDYIVIVIISLLFSTIGSNMNIWIFFINFMYGLVLSLINKLEVIDSNSTEGNRFIIDFSRWGNSSELTDKINIIDNAISQNRCIGFKYNNSNGESSNRKIEPYKIIFKALNWYVYGYCTLKNDMRVFKLTRIKNLEILEEKFEFKDIDIGNLFKEPELETIDVILRVAKEIKIILEDSLPTYETIEEGNSFVIIKTSLPYNNWVDSMILGFGDKVEVLEPKFLREKIIGKIKGMYEMYR